MICPKGHKNVYEKCFKDFRLLSMPWRLLLKLLGRYYNVNLKLTHPSGSVSVVVDCRDCKRFYFDIDCFNDKEAV